MPTPTPTFNRLAGTPGTPQFAEWVLLSTITESDGSTQKLINILHFFRSGGPGTANETDLKTAINVSVPGGNWTPCFNGDVINATQTVRFMDDPTRLAVSFIGFGPGTAVGSRASSFSSVVIQKKGFARGRQYRGSNHWGPPPEGFYDRDVLNNAGTIQYGIWNTSINALCTPFVSGGVDTWQLCILSTSYCDFSLNPSLFTGTLASSTLLNTKLGTMKRRKQNVGV